MLSAGRRLRELREKVGLTLRDVEIASTRIADARGMEDFVINPSRLSDIETKGVLPSIFRLYVLSVLYRTEFNEMLKIYGVDVTFTASDFSSFIPNKTHRLDVVPEEGSVQVPVKFDPGFDWNTTHNLGRMIENWGAVPLQFLRTLSKRKYTYAYIGMQDLTMYPLLLPGAFLQVDETRSRVDEGPWRSEFERPIYFVETREGHICCWCAVKGSSIVLQPHPMSPVLPRILKHPQEAEVIGQVVGVAMRLVEWYSLDERQLQASSEEDEHETKEVRRRSPAL